MSMIPSTPTPTTTPQLRLETHYDQREMRCFAERPDDVIRMWLQAAQRQPQAEALVCGAQRLSWAQLQDQVLRVAAALRARGVAKGDRVALLLGNGPEFVVASYATMAIGAVVVPLSIREQSAGIGYILRDCEAVVLVHDAALGAVVAGMGETPALRHQVVVGGAPDAAQAFAQLLAHAPLPQCEALDEEDLAMLVYTSGTTGFPKGAMLTHLGIVHTILHYAQALGLDASVRGCAVVPLGHVTGLVALMAVTLGLGGTLVVVPHFKAAEMLPLAAQERISFTIMVPAMYQLLLLQENYRQHDLSHWTVGGFGGAPMPPETIDRLAQWLPGLRLSNCYGATETTSPVAVMPAQLTRTHLASVGLALPCADIAVMDDDGRPLPADEVGELWLKGPMVAKGYWNNPQATQENFVDGYWRSGDVGRMDAQGFVYVMDRRKDMLNRGGYKIFSVEVENALCEHPDVLEAAVVAKPCPVLGERVHVFVTLRDDKHTEAEALRRFCAERLADYKVPESFTISRHLLPRNANGKLLKRVLRQELLAAQA